MKEGIKYFLTGMMLGLPIVGMVLNGGDKKNNSGLEGRVSQCEDGRNYKMNNFSEDSDEILLARMLYGEARNCSNEEKIAVAYSVINRVNDGKKWNGETLKEVILKPWQYSCFNKNEVNLNKLKNPAKKVFKKCLNVAKNVLDGKHSELNRGQTHYFNPNVVYPSWADKMTKIGKIKNSKHEFYKEN